MLKVQFYYKIYRRSTKQIINSNPFEKAYGIVDTIVIYFYIKVILTYYTIEN